MGGGTPGQIDVEIISWNNNIQSESELTED